MSKAKAKPSSKVTKTVAASAATKQAVVKPVRQAKKKGHKTFEHVIRFMLSGKPVTVAQLEKDMPPNSYLYRISTYIWEIKNKAGGIIKVTKEGRKVSSYQLMNVDEVQAYMVKRGLATAAPTVQKLQDLKAEPVAVVSQEPTVSV